MKITVKYYDTTITIEKEEDPTLYEMLDTFRSLALAMTFESSSWDEAILEMADEIALDKKLNNGDRV